MSINPGLLFVFILFIITYKTSKDDYVNLILLNISKNNRIKFPIISYSINIIMKGSPK